MIRLNEMIFKETALKGAYLITPEPHEDERGFFARTFCEERLKAAGIFFHIAQINLSMNKKKGTLRGMHYQSKPFEEAKIVQCMQGALYDVILDLRADSASFKKWCAVALSQGNRRLLYIPEGFAHGFQSLEDDTEVLYLMSKPYHPEAASGFSWHDPAFGIEWPLENPILSEKDKSYGPYPSA